MKRSVLVKYVASVLLILGMAIPVYALKDADYLKFKKESPEFAEADAALQATWKEVRALAKGTVKESLVQDQTNWIQFIRDNVAESEGYADKTLSLVETYTLATLDRIRELKFYGVYLKNPDKAVTVRGIIERGHNSVGFAWWVRPENGLIPYTLGVGFDEDQADLEAQVEKFEKEKTLVEVSGKLDSIDWFDAKTIQIRPLQRP